MDCLMAGYLWNILYKLKVITDNRSTCGCFVRVCLDCPYNLLKANSGLKRQLNNGASNRPSIRGDYCQCVALPQAILNATPFLW